jgi:inhibitor of KinA sporulation pathway (predicted exonuclease)
LTTLTQADVDGGMPLAEACQILADEHQAPARLWASCGDYDRKQFGHKCSEFGITYPLLTIRRPCSITKSTSSPVCVRQK